MLGEDEQQLRHPAFALPTRPVSKWVKQAMAQIERTDEARVEPSQSNAQAVAIAPGNEHNQSTYV